MENGTFHKLSITYDAYPFLLFINAEGSHLMILRHTDVLSSKVNQEYKGFDVVSLLNSPQKGVGGNIQLLPV